MQLFIIVYNHIILDLKLYFNCHYKIIHIAMYLCIFTVKLLGSVSQEQLGQHQSAPASNQQSSHAITTGANSQAIAPEKSSANGQQQLQPGM